MTTLSAHPLLLLVAVFCAASSTYASLYVNHPLPTDTCSGGSPCSVEWLDDGQYPLLSDFGAANVGLYHGTQKLVQTIAPVDVSVVRSLQFTPSPSAGPNSDTYYICFTSLALRNGTLPYQAFSPQFNLTSMSGSFSSPVASLTSAIPVPSTVASPPPNSVSTTTVGSPITDVPTASSTSTAATQTSVPGSSISRSQSGFSTVSRPSSSSSTSASQSSSASPTSTNSAHPRGQPIWLAFLSVPLVFLL